MFLTTLALATKAGAMLVRIEQTKAVIDPNPIINLSEIQFFSKGALLTVPSTAFSFIHQSSGFPAAKCNDGVTETLTPIGVPTTSLYNMCKSRNNDLVQTMVINLSGVSIDTIKVYNAVGFNNPSGLDVGQRIVGATLQIFSDTNQLLYSAVFNAWHVIYTFRTLRSASTNADLASDDMIFPNTDDLGMFFQPTFEATQVPQATIAPTAQAPPSKRGPTAVPSVSATVAPTALTTANPTLAPTPFVATDDLAPWMDDMSG